jgi:uncharacterized protein (DUF4415 family)
MSANKPNTEAVWTDPNDAPELTDVFFERADELNGARLVRRGRPKAEVVRERITIRLEPDVLEKFRASGPGWQTRMNAVLSEWLKTHTPNEVRL